MKRGKNQANTLYIYGRVNKLYVRAGCILFTMRTFRYGLYEFSDTAFVRVISVVFIIASFITEPKAVYICSVVIWCFAELATHGFNHISIVFCVCVCRDMFRFRIAYIRKFVCNFKYWNIWEAFGRGRCIYIICLALNYGGFDRFFLCSSVYGSFILFIFLGKLVPAVNVLWTESASYTHSHVFFRWSVVWISSMSSNRHETL